MSRGSDNNVNVGLVIMIIGILMMCLGQFLTVSNLKSEAIENGYALHCPKDGDFAWKGECDE